MSPIDLNIICAIPKTAAFVAGLSGWTRETSLDARFLKMIATSSTAPNVPGGQDTHAHVAATHGSAHTVATHPHTTWPNTGNGSGGGWNNFCAYLGNTSAVQVETHAHVVTPTAIAIPIVTDGPTAWSTENALPPSLLVIFIKSDGTPTGFPPDAILYTLAAPAGWVIADGTGGTDNAVNKMLRGAIGGGDGGALVGTGNAHPHTMAHAHAQTQHQHDLSTDTFTSVVAGMGNGVNPRGSLDLNPHNHNGAGWKSDLSPAANTGSGTDTSNNGDITPPWHKIIPVQNKTGTLSVRKGLIAWWLGALAGINTAKWQLCDGTNGTQNLCQDKYIMGATGVGEIGTTGGTTTHPHTGGGHIHTNPAHSHTKPQTTGGGQYGTGIAPTGCGGAGMDSPPHVHGGGSASSSDAPANTSSVTPTVTAANNTPSYNTVAFIQLMVDEGAPILISSD